MESVELWLKRFEDGELDVAAYSVNYNGDGDHVGLYYDDENEEAVAFYPLKGNRFYSSNFKENDPVLLMRDTTNEFDPHAIAIYTEKGREQLGYIPSTVALLMSINPRLNEIRKGVIRVVAGDQIYIVSAAIKLNGYITPCKKLVESL